MKSNKTSIGYEGGHGSPWLLAKYRFGRIALLKVGKTIIFFEGRT